MGRKQESWDVFISHASEDKEAIARPLALSLRAAGLKVWFDEFALSIGDSLSRSIDLGLANSKFGVVIISKHFLSKRWPQKELAGLFTKETDFGKVILPIWHCLGVAEIRRKSPILADRLGIDSASGIEKLTRVLIAAMNPPVVAPDITGLWFGQTGRLRLYRSGTTYEGDYQWDTDEWVGKLVGELRTTTLSFRWWRKSSSSQGDGLLEYRPAPPRLEGGWRTINGASISLLASEAYHGLTPWSFCREP
jgi:hypothetical protein